MLIHGQCTAQIPFSFRDVLFFVNVSFPPRPNCLFIISTVLTHSDTFATFGLKSPEDEIRGAKTIEKTRLKNA